MVRTIIASMLAMSPQSASMAIARRALHGRLAGRALRRRGVEVSCRHVGAGFGHRKRGGAPDPRPGTGHQHNLILQNRHMSLARCLEAAKTYVAGCVVA
jgi:hypothetical protein